MMCAIEAARRGRAVLLLEHSAKLAEKIRISGGGRCNFTNLHAKPENYLSSNPHFCRSALARYTPQHFIAWLNRHGITFHEKKLGQLFCDQGSAAIIKMLKDECDAAGVQWLMPCSVQKIHSPRPRVGAPKVRNPLSGEPDAELSARYSKSSCIFNTLRFLRSVRLVLHPAHRLKQCSLNSS